MISVRRGLRSLKDGRTGRNIPERRAKVTLWRTAFCDYHYVHPDTFTGCKQESNMNRFEVTVLSTNASDGPVRPPAL
jgi:hypothetical protein